MNKQWLSLGLFAVLAVVGVGCGDDDRSSTDGGHLIYPDLGPDGGPPGVDLGRDGGGGPTCGVGVQCDARGCNGLLICQGEIGYTQGAAGDPVYLPDGGTTSFPGLYFQQGYCTNADIQSTGAREGSPGACDPNPSDTTPGADGCPACAKCVSIGPDPTGINIVQCYQRCAPSATTNPCRTGYTCDLSNQVCIFGCQNDQECQLYREDTNGNGTLESDGPDGGVPQDRLRLDIAGGATCAAATGRCTQPGTTGAEAGDTCVLDSQCEQDGRCISDLSSPGWTDGYCTKFGCDVLGCAGGGKCLDVGGGTNLCSVPCKINSVPADANTGVDSHDDSCRPGYACFWDGLNGVTATINGGCLAGNYNPIATENIGAACNDPDGPDGPRSSDEQCWSPYGLGRCIFAEAIGECTILGCNMLPADACGVGNQCVDLGGTFGCLRTCTVPADCSADGGRPSFGCSQILTTGPKMCYPGCLLNADCNTGYVCTGATATTLGECTLG
jgi:hypothetical protein